MLSIHTNHMERYAKRIIVMRHGSMEQRIPEMRIVVCLEGRVDLGIC